MSVQSFSSFRVDEMWTHGNYLAGEIPDWLTAYQLARGSQSSFDHSVTLEQAGLGVADCQPGTCSYQ
jgi:hypothetical protein